MMLLRANIEQYNTQTSPPNISSWHVILIFFAFFIAVFIVSLLKKLYYRIMLKKKYFIVPRASIKGITNIAMVVSLSVAVLILLTIITSNLFSVLFRAFPGTRITIEGILIKIGGLIFGPFLGMFIGMLTDLLSILMTAGIFHPGYFVAALACGMIAGLIRTIISYAEKRKLLIACVSSALLITTNVVFVLFIREFLPGGLTIEMASSNINLELNLVITLISIFIGLSIVSIWVYLLIINKKNKVNKQRKNALFWNKRNYLTYKMYKKKNKDESINYTLFVASFTCVIISEIFINILAMPFFDSELTSIEYNVWTSIRIALFVPMVILNMAIIYPVYTIILPLVTYKYEKELVEDLNIDL